MRLLFMSVLISLLASVGWAMPYRSQVFPMVWSERAKTNRALAEVLKAARKKLDTKAIQSSLELAKRIPVFRPPLKVQPGIADLGGEHEMRLLARSLSESKWPAFFLLNYRAFRELKHLPLEKQTAIRNQLALRRLTAIFAMHLLSHGITDEGIAALLLAQKLDQALDPVEKSFGANWALTDLLSQRPEIRSLALYQAWTTVYSCTLFGGLL
jgi:hypothetical protein